MIKILEKRGASGSMELSYAWEEDQSGYQPEYINTFTLKATSDDCVTMRHEYQVNDYSPNGHGYKEVFECDIGVDELVKLIKERGTKRRV